MDSTCAMSRPATKPATAPRPRTLQQMRKDWYIKAMVQMKARIITNEAAAKIATSPEVRVALPPVLIATSAPTVLMNAGGSATAATRISGQRARACVAKRSRARKEVREMSFPVTKSARASDSQSTRQARSEVEREAAARGS